MNLSRARLLTKKNLIIACTVVFVVVIGFCAILVSNADENVTLKYRAHVAYKGWLDWQTDGKTAGTTGESRRLEAFKIKLEGTSNGSVVYQTYVRDVGWQSEVKDGATAGTEGKSQQVEAIKIKLSGDVANKYNIKYRVHMKYKGWTEWVSNGAMAGSDTEKLRIEAIEVKLEKKATDSNTTNVENTRGKVTSFTDDEYAMFVALIFCESGMESYEGKLAVANVILNRMYSSKFPNDLKGVIYQKSQFSPAGTAKYNKEIANVKAGKYTQGNYKDCVKAANEAMAGKNNIGTRVNFMTPSAFNRLYSKGGYKNKLVIGNHVFFET